MARQNSEKGRQAKRPRYSSHTTTYSQHFKNCDGNRFEQRNHSFKIDKSMLPPPKRDFSPIMQIFGNIKSDEIIRPLPSRSEKRNQYRQITPSSSVSPKFAYGNSQGSLSSISASCGYTGRITNDNINRGDDNMVPSKTVSRMFKFLLNQNVRKKPQQFRNYKKEKILKGDADWQELKVKHLFNVIQPIISCFKSKVAIFAN